MAFGCVFRCRSRQIQIVLASGPNLKLLLVFEASSSIQRPKQTFGHIHHAGIFQPMVISKHRALVQFRLGSHTLPIEQGRFARPAVPRHLRRCTVCITQAVGDQLHCVFHCPHFGDIRAQCPGLFQDAAGCMRMFMLHKDQKSLYHCLVALLQKAQRERERDSLRPFSQPGL